MSKRNYLTQEELKEYANIDIADPVEADDQISQAEELIDAYVGPQDTFLNPSDLFVGTATSSTDNTLIDTSSDSRLDDVDDGFYGGCQVEIVSGTGAGQVRRITGSDKSSSSLTVDSDWDTNPDATSTYRITQLARFPRHKDCFYDNIAKVWNKSVPDAVRRAVAAQVQYVIEMGESYFAGDQSLKSSESIGNYSYSLGGGSQNGSSTNRIIAPKAKQYLNGIMNRKGVLLRENPTWQ